jgi:hypothetical protein
MSAFSVAPKLTSDMSELSKKHESEEASPLLRLPGELRNKIYDFVIVDCDVGVIQDGSTGESIVTFNEYKSLAQVHHQIRSEVRSFTPDRHEFHVKLFDLDAFCQTFGNTHSNRIISLLIDIRDTPLDENWGYSYEQGLEDAESIAKSTTLLCREGKLQKIVVNVTYLLKISTYMMALKPRLRREVETVRRDVFVHTVTGPQIRSLRRQPFQWE